MEELIKNIVEADKLSRKQVADKKLEKSSVQDQIQAKKDEIKAKYREETKRCIAEKRAEMDEALAVSLKQEETSFEEALSVLQKQYEDHKEEWVERIVKHCLDA